MILAFHITFSACIHPGKSAVMYICAKGIDYAYVSTILQLDFETIFDNAVFVFVLNFIT